MSGTEPAEDAVFMRPWQKIGLWIIVVVIGIGMLFLFSERMTIVGKKQAKADPAHAQVDTNIPPLVRPPATQLVSTGAAPQPRYVPAQSRLGTATDEERAKALNSPIGAYSGRSVPATTTIGQPTDRPAPGSADALEASLQPTPMDGTRVAELPNPRWLIEQGRILACTQVTKINSTLPGGVSAIIPEEIRGETGDTVLFDKGAKIFGTVQRVLMNGADRLGVLWQNITTPVLYDSGGMPHQFRIAVNSPASSELGETGLDGDVNRHLGIKIGGILGYSFVQGGIQALVQEAGKSNGSGNTQLNLNSFQTGGNQAADELLRAWVAIPDVMTRDQGLACAVQVVRDLDMRSAYSLRLRYRSIQ